MDLRFFFPQFVLWLVLYVLQLREPLETPESALTAFFTS